MFNHASLGFPNFYSTSLLARPRKRDRYAVDEARSRDDEAAADDEREPVQPSESQREALRYFEATRSGDESEASNALHKIVEINRGAHNAAGVEAWAHPPLPQRFAAALAAQVGDAPEEDQASHLTSLVSKFEPSVRTLAWHQVSAELTRSRLRQPQTQEQDAEGPSAALSTRALRTTQDDSDRTRRWISELARGDERVSTRGRSEQPLSVRNEPVANSQQPDSRQLSDRRSVAQPQSDESPYNPETDDVAKNLQFYGYEPAQLQNDMPEWRPLVLFDDRVPEGYRDFDVRGGRVRLNKRGFGGYIARRKGTGDFAIMIKGVELSELRLNDVLADDDAGADQVDEVADDVFQQCKALGVFDAIKGDGRLMIIGHSQGAPAAQLLGVYLIVRALNEKPPLLTEAEALRAMKVRGFGGIGALNYLNRLHGADGKQLRVPQSVLDGIDAVTYITDGDPLAERVDAPFIGNAFTVDVPDPATYKAPEPWARGLARRHARSAYKEANYKTARRYRYRTWRQQATDFVGDLYGDAVDEITDTLY